MSLFVGNLSNRTQTSDLQKLFDRYGRCTIDKRNMAKYAFVEYSSEQNAIKAKRELHRTSLNGLSMVVEWSKNSGKLEGSEGQGKR